MRLEIEEAITRTAQMILKYGSDADETAKYAQAVAQLTYAWEVLPMEAVKPVEEA